MSSPCQNGGRCVDDPDGYHCECPKGWEGTECNTTRETCTEGVCVEEVRPALSIL